jgi:hypothetical protein
VQQWLAEHASRIEVFYLPSYLPELNPDKLLNADLKQHATKAAPPRAYTNNALIPACNAPQQAFCNLPLN